MREVPDSPDWMPESTSSIFSDLGFSDKDRAATVLDCFDYRSQLVVIHRMIQSDRASSQIEVERIDSFKNTVGIDQLCAESEYTEACRNSVYNDAARSMAAIGMLAPFVESMFKHAFQGLSESFQRAKISIPNESARKLDPSDWWDCKFYTNSKGKKAKGLARGISEISESIGLSKHFPFDYSQCLSALFVYRNSMFHNGYEWPIAEREVFDKKLKKENWPSEWFGYASVDGAPWIFYMSDIFIERCLQLIDELLTAIGKLCKDKL